MVLIKLLIAHLLGDFFLQPKSWVADKESKIWKSEKLYLHSLLHFVLAIWIVWDKDWILPILLITILHFIIDGIKLQLQKNKNKLIWFLTDQFLHILILFLIVGVKNRVTEYIELLNIPQILLLLLGIMLITLPTSVLLKQLLSKWTIALDQLEENLQDKSLNEAGKYIGMIERLLVFVFILSNHWEAVGFLITAKSVFRYGDLKEGHNRKFTEYILIGTMLSFGIAIFISLLIKFAIDLQLLS